MKPKILIKGTNWIGDAIMTFPAISLLRRVYPSARMDLLARSWVAPIYRCHPGIDTLLEFNAGQGFMGRLSRMLRTAAIVRKKNYDRGVLLTNSFESAFVFRLAGIPRVGGYRTDFRRLLLQTSVPVPRDKEERHHVFYYLNLISHLEDINVKCTRGPADTRLELHIPEEETKKALAVMNNIRKHAGQGNNLSFIGFNPGAAFGPAKCWPATRFRQLAGLLLDAYPRMHILIFGTARERSMAEEIRAADPESMSNLCGRTSLLEAAALINYLDLLVTNDSGLMHVGAACSTPLVAIFGSTNPVATGPWSENARIISRNLDCAPCMSRTCPRNFDCMLGITARDVFRESADILEGRVVG